MITAVLKRPVEMFDAAQAGCIVETVFGPQTLRHGPQRPVGPGILHLQRIENPFGHAGAPWLVLSGTRIGATEAYWRQFPVECYGEDGIEVREWSYVLSLWQPWATLWVIGAKRIETRDWRTKYRGEIYIHATAGVPRDDRDWVDEFTRSDAVGQALTDYGFPSGWDTPFPTGAILGKTNLLDCRSTNEASSFEVLGVRQALPPPVGDNEYTFGNYGPDRWMWLTEGAEAFPQPIPARGHQRLWRWERPL